MAILTPVVRGGRHPGHVRGGAPPPSRPPAGGHPVAPSGPAGKPQPSGHGLGEPNLGFPTVLPGGKVVPGKHVKGAISGTRPRGLPRTGPGAVAPIPGTAPPRPLGAGAPVTPEGFAESLLAKIGAPPTKANIDALVAWQAMEGGNWGNTAHFNPLNTTLPAPGATSMNSVGVKAYTSWQQGLNATVATLQGSSAYQGIIADLRAGRGLGAQAAGGLSTWSGGGYSSVNTNLAAGYAGAVGGPSGRGGGSQPGSNLGGIPTPGRGGMLGAGPTSTGGGAGGGGGGGGGGAPSAAQAAADIAFPGLAGLGIISGPIGSVSNLVTAGTRAIDWLLIPSHWVRIFAGIGGGALVLGGIWTMTRAGGPYRSASVETPLGTKNFPGPGGSLAAPLGILEVGVGGVLLFVAFHNLPPNVKTFGEFMNHLASAIQTGTAQTVAPASAAAGG